MAKVRLNPVLEQIRGQVGDLVFKRYGDEVVISRKPDASEVEPTAAQLAHRQRFRQATLYGKMVMADPEAKALYEQVAKAKGQPLFSLTVADFYHAPSVDEVDLSGYAGRVGDPVVVLASDDFQVVSVAVSVSDAAGNPIESGAASEDPPRSGRWLYNASAAVPAGTIVRIAVPQGHYVVTAEDRPGGVAEASQEKAL